MKLLTLLRHAKSDWGDPGLSDFDRPLNERGRKDAPAVGSFFERAGLTPDLIVSSPARRARQTCDLFAQEAGYKKRISWEESIYAASSQALLAVVRSLPDDVGHVLLVGHNPGFEDLAGALIGADEAGVYSLRMPTAAAAHFVLAVDVWREVQPGGGQLQWLVTPKLLKAAGGC